MLLQFYPMRSIAFLFIVAASSLTAQVAPYQNPLPADPPYYRVRYEASDKPGELIYPVSYTAWVPPGVKAIRGVIVHQHGCGEGSCKSGQTGAFDLHWQALAKKHDCALVAPAVEQPEKADCQKWCDPRNGSDAAFQKALAELGGKCGHPELSIVPWALWGHSGGGFWSGGMVLLHPDRVAAAWLRSGTPPVRPVEGRPAPYTVSEAACQVPVMCNLGTKEGVTVKDGRFAGGWKGVDIFYSELRAKGAIIAVSVDPFTAHECGNQRYLAIPWLDTCLTARLPAKNGEPLKAMPESSGWLAPLHTDEPEIIAAVPAAKFTGSKEKSIWLPNEDMAIKWKQYITDTKVADTTPPPAPSNVQVKGNEITWEAEADLESGLAPFIIERDGKFLANAPEKGNNPFGRPIFQNNAYSDTPTQPLVKMQFTDTTAEAGKTYKYRVISVNTVGLKSN